MDDDPAVSQQADDSNPKSAAAQAALGDAQYKSEDFKSAAESFKTAFELGQKNAPRLELLWAWVKHRAKPAVWILVVFVALAAVVRLSLPDLSSILRSHQSSLAAPCGSTAKVPSASPGPTVTAKLLGGQRTEADFGRALISRTLILNLSLSAVPRGGLAFHVTQNQFLRSDDASLNPHEIAVNAKRVGKVLVLSVCFDRNVKSPLGDPGSYSGSVTVDDSRLSSPVIVPLTVTMQYSNWAFLLWLYFAAAVPGIWCVWVLRSGQDGKDRALSLKFFTWAGTVSGLVALVAGCIAAFAVFTAVYLRDPTWGYSGLQPVTLYGGMFSAFVTTSGLASLTSQKP
jgi:hypothetical protein